MEKVTLGRLLEVLPGVSNERCVSIFPRDGYGEAWFVISTGGLLSTKEQQRLSPALTRKEKAAKKILEACNKKAKNDWGDDYEKFFTFINGVTVCKLVIGNDGDIGVCYGAAYCRTGDTYSQQIGCALSFMRAIWGSVPNMLEQPVKILTS